MERLLDSIIEKYKCRCFIMFDCCNSGRIFRYKYRYDVKKLEENIDMKRENKMSNIIFFSSNAVNSNVFEKFLEKNLINNDKNKFYGELTIFFLQVLKNYLEKNLSFSELTYEKLVMELNEYLNDLTEEGNRSVDYKLTHSFLLNNNLLPILTISNNHYKSNKFFYNLEEDENEIQIQTNNLNLLKRRRYHLCLINI